MLLAMEETPDAAELHDVVERTLSRPDLSVGVRSRDERALPDVEAIGGRDDK